MENVWNIPVTWEISGIIEVSKNDFPTLEKAMEFVATDNSIGLPNGNYVDSSFRLSFGIDEIEEVREFYNAEDGINFKY